MPPAACCLAFCEKPGTKVCSACKEERYCSAEHQKAAWKMHKSDCQAVQAQRRNCNDALRLLKESESSIETVSDGAERVTKIVEASARNAARLIELGVLGVLVQAATTWADDAAAQAKLMEATCAVCFASGVDDARRDEACDAGLLESAAEALRRHSAAPRVVPVACQLVRRLLDGEADEGVDRRCERATSAGAIEAVVGAMSPTETGIAAQEACSALCMLTFGIDNVAAEARSERAAQCNAIEEVVRAMRKHAPAAPVQTHACSALTNICAGSDEGAKARRQRAIDAGAVEAIERAAETEGRAKMALDVLMGTDSCESLAHATEDLSVRE
jgi:hypothetical protein